MPRRVTKLPSPPARPSGGVGVASHESQLVAAVAPWTSKLLQASSGASTLLVPELGTDHGLADLVALALPPAWLSRRRRINVPPITQRRLASIVVAFRRGERLSEPALERRVRHSSDGFRDAIRMLEEIGALRRHRGKLGLRTVFGERPLDSVAIEVKVSDWRSGLAQSAMYGLFSHSTYLALPTQVAMRVKLSKGLLAANGIGLLGIEDTDTVRVVIRARRRPRPPRLHQFLLMESAFSRSLS